MNAAFGQDEEDKGQMTKSDLNHTVFSQVDQLTSQHTPANGIAQPATN